VRFVINILKQEEKGVSLISAAIVLPLILLIMAILFDLGRIYLTTIFAKEIAISTAKFAVSFDPDTSIPELDALINPVSGEHEDITSSRRQFWRDQIDQAHSDFHGLTYFTKKELRVFNLSYGFMYDMNKDVAFPIPSDLDSKEDLAGKVSCSIYFNFADLVDSTILNQNYSRVYYVECAMPLFGLGMFSSLIGSDFILIKKSAYAYRSGDINP